MSRIPGVTKIGRIWLHLSLPAKGGAVVAIPVVCTIAMLFLLADVQRRFEAANQWVVHTEQVLSQSREILAASLSTEATARGYLLTRGPAFLDLHRKARKRVSDGFARILQQTQETPVQRERMRHAMRLMRDEVAALDAQFSAPPDKLVLLVDVSRQRIDTLKAEIDEFDAEERRLLAARRLETDRQRGRLRYGLWAFCFAGAISAISGSMLFTTSVRRRLDRIAENATRFSRRESNGAVDRSPDAIGRLEQTLISTTQTLLEREQRLSENAAELERAKLSAEAAMKAKTEFVSNISHEIRSPMNALLGAADMLGATELSAKQAEYVTMIDRAGHNLLSVVDEVLDHAKIESGRLELERTAFDLAAVVDRVATLMSVMASDKGLDLLTKTMPGVPQRVVGDPARLQRVLINLVSNAIKFTDAGFVAIKIEPANVLGLLHFSVADTGIGIPRHRQDAIFQEYTQAGPSTTRHYGGTGLGLAISKRIVELMQGRIWVESEEGAGSTFHFIVEIPAAPELPVERRAAAPVAKARPAGVGGRRRLGARILLAEDSAPSVSLIRAYLSDTDCLLDVATDGEEALARLVAARYDLVLMDAQMPKLDGYEAMRRFREWERANGRPRTPIVAVTAHAFQEDIERALKAGADAQLTKPFRRDSLLEAIELYQRLESSPDIRVDVPEFLRELAPEFLRRQRYGLLAVSTALKSEKYDPIQSFAHNMKGCGKSFGFPRLTDLGREMERSAIERDAGSLRRQIDELRLYLTEVDVA